MQASYGQRLILKSWKRGRRSFSDHGKGRDKFAVVCLHLAITEKTATLFCNRTYYANNTTMASIHTNSHTHTRTALKAAVPVITTAEFIRRWTRALPMFDHRRGETLKHIVLLESFTVRCSDTSNVEAWWNDVNQLWGHHNGSRAAGSARCCGRAGCVATGGLVAGSDGVYLDSWQQRSCSSERLGQEHTLVLGGEGRAETVWSMYMRVCSGKGRSLGWTRSGKDSLRIQITSLDMSHGTNNKQDTRKQKYKPT